MRHPYPVNGRGTRRAPGAMNQLEQRFQNEILEPRRAAGEIIAWWYEGIKLRVGEKCFYTPDFPAMEADGTIILNEVKGHMEDDAQVKLRAMAALYPFPLHIWRWTKKTGWTCEVR